MNRAPDYGQIPFVAYDEKLAARIRKAFGNHPGVSEKKMFGGLCFLVNGNMACGVTAEDMMVRVGPDAHEKVLKQKGARPMDFTGRPMKGMVFVGEDGLKGAALKKWVGYGRTFAGSLPAKTPKGPKIRAKKSPVKKASAKKTAPKKTPVESGAFAGFSKKTLSFIRGIEKNNSKKWFEAHRADYDEHYIGAAKSFIAEIGPRLKKVSKTINFEPRVNGSIFRINRDVRFSKDKTPYKAHLDLWFWEGDRKGWDAPGLFFRLTPKQLIVGGGMHQFGKASEAAYREAVVESRKGKALEKILSKLDGYTIGGKTRKKVPRGFDADHPRAELLLHSGLHAAYEGKHPAELSSPEFVDWCVEHFAHFKPLHAWLLKLA